MRKHHRRLVLLEHGRIGDSSQCPVCQRPIGQQPRVVLPDNTRSRYLGGQDTSQPCPTCGSLPLVIIVMPGNVPQNTAHFDLSG